MVFFRMDKVRIEGFSFKIMSLYYPFDKMLKNYSVAADASLIVNLDLFCRDWLRFLWMLTYMLLQMSRDMVLMKAPKPVIKGNNMYTLIGLLEYLDSL